MENWNYGAFFQDDWRITDRAHAEPRRPLRLLQPDHRRLGQTSTWSSIREVDTGVPQSGAAQIVIAGPTGPARERRPTSPTRTTCSRASASRGTSWATAGWRCAAAPACSTTSCATTSRCSRSCRTRSRSSRSTATRRWRIRSASRGPPVIGQLYVDRPQHHSALHGGLQHRLSMAVHEQHDGRDGVCRNNGYDLLQFEEMNQPIYVAGQTTTANKDCSGPIQVSLRAALDQLGASEYKRLETSLQRRFANGLGFQARVHAVGSKDSRRISTPARRAHVLLAPQDDADIPAPNGRTRTSTPGTAWSSPRSTSFRSARASRWLTTGAMSHIFGGWMVASIWTWQSGFPYNVFDGSDICLTAGSYTPTCRPNLIGDPILPADERTPTRWFNAAAFQRTRSVSSATRHATQCAARNSPTLIFRSPSGSASTASSRG